MHVQKCLPLAHHMGGVVDMLKGIQFSTNRIRGL